ncbi:hypothetical protein CBL_07457 [Carabus blaptoides fortunei]
MYWHLTEQRGLDELMSSARCVATDIKDRSFIGAWRNTIGPNDWKVILSFKGGVCDNKLCGSSIRRPDTLASVWIKLSEKKESALELWDAVNIAEGGYLPCVADIRCTPAQE